MLLVSNIQRFCVSDGPGIRTTVFFKGCVIHCPWCCNPENISFKRQLFYRQEKCRKNTDGFCDSCKKLIESLGASHPDEMAGQVCDGVAPKICHAIGVYGEPQTDAQILSVVKQDMAFYRHSGGGVTLSGGEPLAHPIDDLLAGFAAEGIAVVIETSLTSKQKDIVSRFQSVSHFIVDAKIMDEARSKKVLGVSSEVFRANILALANAGKRIWLRIPLIEGYTTDNENIHAIADLLECVRPEQIELLPCHSLGYEKYGMIGQTPERCQPPDAVRIQEIAGYLTARLDIKVSVLHL